MPEFQKKYVVHQARNFRANVIYFFLLCQIYLWSLVLGLIPSNESVQQSSVLITQCCFLSFGLGAYLYSSGFFRYFAVGFGIFVLAAMFQEAAVRDVVSEIFSIYLKPARFYVITSNLSSSSWDFWFFDPKSQNEISNFFYGLGFGKKASSFTYILIRNSNLFFTGCLAGAMTGGLYCLFQRKRELGKPKQTLLARQ